MSLDDVLMEELRQEQERNARLRLDASCADGYCGADDCQKCRPGSYRFATWEDVSMSEKKEPPQVKIEINCICGQALEAATYLDHGLIKLVIAPCRCCTERGVE